MINRFFNFIYRLEYGDCIRWCILLVLIARYLQYRFHEKRWLRCIWSIMLLFAVCGIVYGTVWSRGEGVYQPEWIPFHSYRQVFSSGDPELLRSNFMNMFLFFPMGILVSLILPGRWSVRRRFLTVAVGCACLSFSIELAQYCFALGHFEADDVLHNTIGAVLGCLAILFRGPD